MSKPKKTSQRADRLQLSDKASAQLADLTKREARQGKSSFRVAILSAKKSKADGKVESYSSTSLDRWNQDRIAHLMAKSQSSTPDMFVAASQEIGEDEAPFQTQRDHTIPPPYSFDVLSTLLAANVMHQSCVETKAGDISSNGYEVIPVDGAKEILGEAGLQAAMEDAQHFFLTCSGGNPVDVLINALAVDNHGLGNCGYEPLRDRTALVANCNHIPFAMMRVLQREFAKRTNCKYVQKRFGKSSYFMEFGSKVKYTKDNFNPATAKLKDFPKIEERGDAISFVDKIPQAKYPDKLAKTPLDGAANEYVMMARPPFILSQTYGTPAGVSAVQYMLAQIMIDSYNLQFFKSKGVPQYAVIIEGLTPPTDDVAESGENGDEVADSYTELQEEIREFFTDRLQRADRSVVVLTTFGEATIKLEKLSEDNVDAAFEKYELRTREMIRLAHRTPPAALGIHETANLGSGRDISQLRRYNNHIIMPGQRAFESQFNTMLRVGRLNPWVQLRLNKLDIEDIEKEREYTRKIYEDGVIDLDEFRSKLGYEVYGPEKGGNLRFIRGTGAFDATINSSPEQLAAAFVELEKKIAKKIKAEIMSALDKQDDDEIDDDALPREDDDK